MFLPKLKKAAVVILVLSILVGATALIARSSAGDQPPQASDKIGAGAKTRWEYASLVVDDATAGAVWQTGKTTIDIRGDVNRPDLDRSVKELHRKLGGKDENPTFGVLLNLFGQEGWEMVSYAHPQGVQVWMFKRPSP